MNLIQRYKSPTPKFFKRLRNIGIALATAGGAILAAPIALPAIVTTIAVYVSLAGTVATAVSQAVVSDAPEPSTTEKTGDSKN
ncbi:hypothetical protein V8G61_04740 [Gaetbulibacter sp. M240]|uniref:hypothetical protein n=1 Tax=Gaetbulibacter sp. M240 TaxID=3126511 RepID=UPI00374EA13D